MIMKVIIIFLGAKFEAALCGVIASTQEQWDTLGYVGTSNIGMVQNITESNIFRGLTSTESSSHVTIPDSIGVTIPEVSQSVQSSTNGMVQNSNGLTKIGGLSTESSSQVTRIGVTIPGTNKYVQNHTNGMVRNSTEHAEFGVLIQTDLSSHLKISERTGVIIPEISQSAPVSRVTSNPDFGSKTLRINHSRQSGQRAAVIHQNKRTTLETTISVEEPRKRNKPIKHKCQSCPTDQNYCCQSGCCGKLAFWIDTPVLLYYLLIFILLVSLIVVLLVMFSSCKKSIKESHEDRGPVMYEVKERRIKVRNIGSASTCESSLTEELAGGDVFDIERPEVDVDEKSCDTGNYGNHFDFQTDYLTDDTTVDCSYDNDGSYDCSYDD